MQVVQQRVPINLRQIGQCTRNRPKIHSMVTTPSMGTLKKDLYSSIESSTFKKRTHASKTPIRASNDLQLPQINKSRSRIDSHTVAQTQREDYKHKKLATQGQTQPKTNSMQVLEKKHESITEFTEVDLLRIPIQDKSNSPQVTKRSRKSKKLKNGTRESSPPSVQSGSDTNNANAQQLSQLQKLKKLQKKKQKLELQNVNNNSNVDSRNFPCLSQVQFSSMNQQSYSNLQSAQSVRTVPHSPARLGSPTAASAEDFNATFQIESLPNLAPSIIRQNQGLTQLDQKIQRGAGGNQFDNTIVNKIMGDCDKQMHKTKQMISKLDKLGNQLILSLEIGQNLHISPKQTIKIPCHQAFSPCQIYLKKPQNWNCQGLVCYVSTREINPSKKSHDFKYINPVRVVINAKRGKSIFNAEFLYVTFDIDPDFQDANYRANQQEFSDFEISAFFNTQKVKRNTVMDSEGLSAAFSQAQANAFQTLVRDKIAENLSPKDDFLLATKGTSLTSQIKMQNMVNKIRKESSDRQKAINKFVKVYPVTQQKPKFDFEDRHSEVTQRRKQLERLKVLETLANKSKWDLVRKEREALTKRFKKQKQRQELASIWAQHILPLLVIKKAYCNFKHFRDERIERMKLEFVVSWCKIKLRVQLRKIAPHIDARYCREITNSMPVSTMILHENLKQRAQKLLLQFLVKTSLGHDVYNHLTNTFQMLVRIQNAYRNHRESIKNREKFFADEIWTNEVDAISSYLIKNKKSNPQFSRIILQINVIPHAVKARVIHLYSARCNMLHCIRFLKYLAIKRNAHDKHELYETINQRLIQLHEIDKLLFGSIECQRLQLPNIRVTPRVKLIKSLIDDPMYSSVTLPQPPTGKKAKNYQVDPALQKIKDVEYYNYLMNPQMPGEQGVSKHYVPGESYFYWIHANGNFPSFMFVPSSLEILHRLILKAVDVQDIEELNLKFSNC